MLQNFALPLTGFLTLDKLNFVYLSFLSKQDTSSYCIGLL